MDKLAFEYPNGELPGQAMNLGVLAVWIAVLCLTGFAARKVVRARPVLGFMGDAGFGLLGLFVVGSLLKAFEISLMGSLGNLGGVPIEIRRYVDIALVSFIGALALRAVLKPITK
jgi:uncharacterized membrane protein YeaQ/YmgE (transglycosylase-associated protein family)